MKLKQVTFQFSGINKNFFFATVRRQHAMKKILLREVWFPKIPCTGEPVTGVVMCVVFNFYKVSWGSISSRGDVGKYLAKTPGSS